MVVANDATFTESDFRALARIGQGSKLEKLASTGRFGLGFSSTYHLTDTPTFVSGDYMVIFDPHCAFAPGATTNQPGLRIRFTRSALPTSFRDQFAPFQHFGCDFSEPYNGTLFRFPLRTAALARRSEISKRSYSADDAKANLSQFSTQLSQHLLFLRSVRTVEIYHSAEGAAGPPALLHRATAAVTDTHAQHDQSLLSFFDKNAYPAGAAPPRDLFYQKLRSVPDHQLPLLTCRVNVEINTYPGAAMALAGAVGAATVARVGEGVAQGERAERVDFLVVSGLQGGAAKRMACDESTRHLKLVPFGAVAACVGRTGASALSMYPTLPGQAFCFLPLPVHTQLPVHVNAFWELSSNRRDIWRGDDTTGNAKV